MELPVWTNPGAAEIIAPDRGNSGGSKGGPQRKVWKTDKSITSGLEAEES